MTPPDRSSPSPMDAEAIARVLDGRATPDERARLLGQADESPELLELLADSAAAMNAADASTDGVVMLEARRARRIPPAAWVGIAAALIIAVTIPGLWPDRDALPAVPLVSPGGTAVLGPARIGPEMPAFRGGVTSEGRGPPSVTIGARLVDYMAVTSDTSQYTIGVEIAAALRAIPGGTAVATRFAGGNGVTPETLEAVEEVVDVRVFRTAAWTERVRLAAVARDSSALRHNDVLPAFKAMARDKLLPSEARANANRMRALLEARSFDWPAIEQQATQILAALAGSV